MRNLLIITLLFSSFAHAEHALHALNLSRAVIGAVPKIHANGRLTTKEWEQKKKEYNNEITVGAEKPLADAKKSDKLISSIENSKNKTTLEMDCISEIEVGIKGTPEYSVKYEASQRQLRIHTDQDSGDYVLGGTTVDILGGDAEVKVSKKNISHWSAKNGMTEWGGPHLYTNDTPADKKDETWTYYADEFFLMPYIKQDPDTGLRQTHMALKSRGTYRDKNGYIARQIHLFCK